MYAQSKCFICILVHNIFPHLHTCTLAAAVSTPAMSTTATALHTIHNHRQTQHILMHIVNEVMSGEFQRDSFLLSCLLSFCTHVLLLYLVFLLLLLKRHHHDAY